MIFQGNPIRARITSISVFFVPVVAVRTYVASVAPIGIFVGRIPRAVRVVRLGTVVVALVVAIVRSACVGVPSVFAGVNLTGLEVIANPVVVTER